MSRARSATAIIWSTVVSAGAMLGMPACSGGGTVTTRPAPRVAMPPPEPTPPAEPIAVGVADPIETLDDPTPPSEPPPVVEAARVKLTITSKPAGADVYGSDGELRGRTPLMLEVPMDLTFTLRVTRDGYAEQELAITPTADAAFAVELVKAKRPRGNGGGKGTGRGFVLS